MLPCTHLFGIVADMLKPLASGGMVFSDDKLSLFKDLQLFSPAHMNLPRAVIYTLEKVNHNRGTSRDNGGSFQKIVCTDAKIEEANVRKMLDYIMLGFLLHWTNGVSATR